MACKYCLKNELPEDVKYCPKCGERMEVARGLRFIGEMAETMFGLLRGDLITDENGNIMEVERKPFNVDHCTFGDTPLAKLDWENTDISRETIWLEAHSVINGEETE